MKTKVKTGVLGLAAVLLVGALLFSGWQILSVLLAYQKEKSIKQEMLAYKPKAVLNDSFAAHPGILEAKAINPHVVGWITIPGTAIDYAFVQAKDNKSYLRQDLHGEYALAGTLFLDHRNNPDFTEFKSIIYGHNMKNSSMFGDLEQYRDVQFMEENPKGELFLEDRRYTFTIFACLEAEPDSEDIYTLPASDTGLQQTLTWIEKNALAYNKTQWNSDGRLLILSTCADDAGETRLVVAAQLEAA